MNRRAVFYFLLVLVVGADVCGQSKFLQTQSTSNFRLRYDKSIRASEIREIGKRLESTYAEYRKKFEISQSDKLTIYVFASVGRFKSESHSKAFDDGDYSNGRLYLVAPGNDEVDTIQSVLARIVSRAVLDRVSGCPPWLADAYSLYAGNDLSRFGRPARVAVSTFADLSEDYSHAEQKADVKEVFAKLAVTIQFLVDRFGEATVESAFRGFRTGKSLEEVFQETFGRKLADIEKEWVLALQLPVR